MSNLQKINEPEIRKALNNMCSVFAFKNKKYGNSFEISLDKYGIIAALTRISDKFNRIENLILTNDDDVDDETVEDVTADASQFVPA